MTPERARGWSRLVGRPPVPWGDVAVVLAGAVLAGGLSLVDLTRRSLGFDEGATVAIVSQSGHALGHAIARDGGNMSGYYLLLHLCVSWFGDGLWVLRLPSVAFSAATGGLTAALGLALFDRRVAWRAALLGATSLTLVFWGQTARGYAAMLCFATAGMLAFVRLLQASDAGRPGRGAALAYTLTMTLAAYASFVVVLVIPAQLVGVIACPRAARRFAVALAGLIVLCVPLVVLAYSRGSGQLFWLPRPDGHSEVQVVQSLASTGLSPSFRRVATTTPGWILTVLAVLALVLVRGHSPGGSSCGRPRRLVLAWALVPGLVAWVYSLFAPQPLFLARNLLVCLPAVALALAAGLGDRRLPRWAAGAGLALALVVRLVPLAAGYGDSPEPWRAVAHRVLARARPGDCLVFYPEDGRNAFRWYVARDQPARAPRAVVPRVSWSATRPYVEIYATLSSAQVAALPARCPRVWLISSHEGQSDGPPQARAHRRRWLTLRARLGRAYAVAPTVSLGRASTIHVQLFHRGPAGSG